MEVPCLNLTLELLEQYANGTLHATVVQRIAAAAWADGWGLRGIELMRYMREAGPNHRNLDDVREEVSRAWGTEYFDIDPMAKRLAFASISNADRDITRAASPNMIGIPGVHGRGYPVHCGRTTFNAMRVQLNFRDR